MKNVKFNIHSVEADGKKVKVWYHLDVSRDGAPQLITLYAKEYGYGLHEIFPGAHNETEIMVDYFEKSRFCILSDSPYWNAALDAINRLGAYHAKKQAQKERNRVQRHLEALAAAKTTKEQVDIQRLHRR